MYFKLSLTNVKKSFKDYALYFLTLTFSVCIFYIFNSIEAQKAMMSISESTNEMLQSITKIMSMLSIFVSFVLGFLIVYANNFLVRRRKKEIGIYMTLGMDKSDVAKLLVVETFLIGVLSLGAGLIAGIFVSQSLSVVTAKLFEVDMTGYHFIFSSAGFFKTILYFGIIFLIVMAMSTITTTKYKLITLLNAEKQNEQQKLKNPILTSILFVLSIACLITAYSMVMKNGLRMLDKSLLIEVVLGSIGTFLFFASLSGFFLRVMQSNKKHYYKNLNMFILRQINSKINTTHISMSFICLMLFFTISILSTGLGLNNVMNASFSSAIPFDASFQAAGKDQIHSMLSQKHINVAQYAESTVEYDVYDAPENTSITGKNIMEESTDEKFKSNYGHAFSTTFKMIKLSDYNKLMKLQHKKELLLSQEEAAFSSDAAEALPQLRDSMLSFIGSRKSVKIQGENYKLYKSVLTAGLITSPSSNLSMVLIVPDHAVEGARVSQGILALNVKGNKRTTEQKLMDQVKPLLDLPNNRNIKTQFRFTTAEEVKSIAIGSKAIIAFIGIYLGIIFMIASAAILALQQLSEATDNKRRYEIIQKIGGDEKLINRTLFKQIAIYFLLPLSLAIVHSIIGIKVVSDTIRGISQINMLGNIMIVAVLITVVYGAYFAATYLSSKQILLKK